jgi:uncharacterized protein YwgA
MTLSADYALVAEIIKELETRGSWCGETHVQKSAFVAKDLLHVPLSGSFILYKHGPYSFDLSATLVSMRADRVLSLTPKGEYGPSFSLESNANTIFARYKTVVDQNATKIQYVASQFASKNVAELERIATAIFVTLKRPVDAAEARAAQLNSIKPHINLNTALAAVQEADRLIAGVPAGG